MSVIPFLAANPNLCALLALSIVVFPVCFVVAGLLGRVGVEIGFVFNVTPPTRRMIATVLGAFASLVLGAVVGALVGERYGLGPDHVLLGSLCFLGLTVGTYLGGANREPLALDPTEERLGSISENLSLERMSWVSWHYTGLELSQLVAAIGAAFLGLIVGSVSFAVYADPSSGGKRIVGIILEGGIGGVLGVGSVLLAKPHGLLRTIFLGMILGLGSAGALGVLLISIGRQNGYMLPGLVYGGLGGFCFGLLGGDPIIGQPAE